MARRAFIAAAALAALLAQPARAQLAVIDNANIAATLKNYYQQVQSYLQQVQQTVAALNTLNALVQNPNLGSALLLMNQVGVQTPLTPMQGMQLQNFILSAGNGNVTGALGSLNALASSASAANHIYTPMTSGFAGTQIATNANVIASAQAIAQSAFNSLGQQLAVLQQLQAQAASATTPAQRENIANALQTTQTAINGQVGQIQAAYMLVQLSQQNLQQQAAEKAQCNLDATLTAVQASGGLVITMPASATSAPGQVTGSCPNASGASSAAPASTTAGVGTDATTTDWSNVSGSTATVSAGTSTSLDAMTSGLGATATSQIASNATALGVQPAAVQAVCQMESGCNASVGQSASSSATGPFQMTTGTYNGLVQTLNANPAVSGSIIPGAAGQADPVSSGTAAAQLLANNAQTLENSGISSPTVEQAYALYQWGATPGATLAQVPSNEPMSTALQAWYSPSVLASNGIAPSETVGQYFASIESKVGAGVAQSPVLYGGLH